MTLISYERISTPIGALLLIADAKALRFLHFPNEQARVRVAPDWTRGNRVIEKTARQLAEYFAGQRRTFDLPLAPTGTEFQRRVWQALSTIPYGEARSYAAIAKAIGRPTAMRAVGGANGRNPIPIIVPCHRVIGAKGALTGYGGGLERKRFLLALERSGESSP